MVRNRKRRNLWFGCGVAVLLVSALCGGIVALGAPLLYVNVPEPPLRDFTPEPTAAVAFQQMVEQVEQQARDEGTFEIAFDERQISSWINLNGEDYAARYGYYTDFQNVQVGLDNNTLTVYGEVLEQGLTIPLQMLIRPSIDGAGQIQLQIVDSHLGGLGVPSFLAEDVLNQIESTMTSSLDNLQGEYMVNHLQVDDGLFTASGTLRNP